MSTVDLVKCDVLTLVSEIQWYRNGRNYYLFCIAFLPPQAYRRCQIICGQSSKGTLHYTASLLLSPFTAAESLQWCSVTPVPIQNTVDTTYCAPLLTTMSVK